MFSYLNLISCINFCVDLNHGLKPNPGFEHIPQVSPILILMYPYSPHLTPQEFFNFHAASVNPTKKISWFTSFPQFYNTPDR